MNSARDVRSRLAAASLIVLAALACRGRTDAPSRTTPVILISIDTLRSDHLPAYGYKGVATPAIDRLRADSILFERAYSHVPMTLPSHASILSGLLPTDTRVHDNVGFRVADSIPMIQDVLKKNGYATGAAVSAFVLRRETGIARGFDFYDDKVDPLGEERMIGRVQRDGRQTLHALESWLDANTQHPFFAFLHLYEPHTPYTPPEPFLSRYANHYDGEIAAADAIVGDFMDDLKRRNVYDDALIILLSDHGEGLGEHGEDEHAIFVYREVLQVPLIVKLPHQTNAGSSVATPVQLIDVFPTILERTDTQAAPNANRRGQSLLTLLHGGPQREIYAESYYARFHFGWSDLHSLISGNDHFIRAPQPELYDLAHDPHETRNTIDANRRVYVRLSSALEPLVRDAAAPSKVDPEEAAKLAALGYVGTTVTTQPGQSLPDPKSSLATYHDIRQAFTWYRNGKEEDALTLTNKLLATNRQIGDLWDLKFRILDKLNRKREAIEAAKDGLRSVPTESSLLLDVAKAALDIGDLDTAQQHAELAIATFPSKGHEILAYVWARRGDPKRAEQEAKLSLQNSNDPAAPLMQLASIEKERGNFDRALQYLNDAVTREGGHITAAHEGLHLLRGDVLARLGRNDEAEREFRTEIAHFPSSANAYSSLILLLSATGRADEATQLVYALVNSSPGPHAYAVVSETLKAVGDDRGAVYWAYQGLQKYPKDPELRDLPKKLSRAM